MLELEKAEAVHADETPARGRPPTCSSRPETPARAEGHKAMNPDTASSLADWYRPSPKIDALRGLSNGCPGMPTALEPATG